MALTRCRLPSSHAPISLCPLASRAQATAPEVLRTRSLNWKKEKGLPSRCCGPRWNSCSLRTQVSGWPGFLWGQTHTDSYRSWKQKTRNAAGSWNSLREAGTGFAVFPSSGTQEVTNLHHPPERGNLSNLLFCPPIFLCFKFWSLSIFSWNCSYFSCDFFGDWVKIILTQSPYIIIPAFYNVSECSWEWNWGRGIRGFLAHPHPALPGGWWGGRATGCRIPASISPPPGDEGLTSGSSGVLSPQEYLVSTVNPD